MKVSPFAYKGALGIQSLCLSMDKKTLFSGCRGVVLARHCMKTREIIGKPQQLDLGGIRALDQNSNLLLVGGYNTFGLYKIPKDRGTLFNISLTIYSLEINPIDYT